MSVSVPQALARHIEGFAVFDVSTGHGWAEGRRQREEWGRDRSAVVPLDLDRVLVVLFAGDVSTTEAAA
jgi:hypothetical protein